MKGDNGASHKEAIKNVTCYLLGIVTVAVVCCSDLVWQAVEPDYSEAATSDGGEDSPDLSTVAFVFNEGFEEIAGLHASAYVIGSDKNPLSDSSLHLKDGLLVVEAQTDRGMTVHFDFQFVDRDDEVVAMFKAETPVDQSLITFHGMEFGNDEIVIQHSQPSEVELSEGDSVEIPLENQMKLWSDGRFHLVRRLVRSPNDSEVESSDCDLLDFDPPINTVGIVSDADSGEIVHLESVP